MTIHEYIDKLVRIFGYCWDILTPDGSLWVNIGDGFNTSKKGNTNGQNKTGLVKQKEGVNKQKINKIQQPDIMEASYLLVPERFLIKMQEAGWGVRDKVVWKKPDGMPNSQPDRLTPDYEMLYRFTKQRYAYFDTQYEPYQSDPKVIKKYREQEYGPKFGGNKANGYNSDIYSGNAWDPNIFGRHKRSVWEINTAKLKINHFAAFPEKLVEIPILSTCPPSFCPTCGWKSRTTYKVRKINTRPGKNIGKGKSGTGLDPHKLFHNTDISKHRQAVIREPISDTSYYRCNCGEGCCHEPGIVMDIFMGSGTTALTALKHGRRFIGIELNPDYIKIAQKRLSTMLESYLPL